MTDKKKRAKRTPAQREAIKYAYWNKWCPGGNPNKVIRTKGITNDVWNVTPVELDKALRDEVK